MKKLIMIFSMLCVLLIASATVSAANTTTVRIALLPLQAENSVQLSNASSAALETQFRQTLQTFAPNSTIQYVPTTECQTAYRETVNELNGASDLNSVLQPLAKKLHADIVLQPTVTAYQQRDYMHLNAMRTKSAMYTQSNIAITLIGYDSQQNEIFHAQAVKNYDNEQSSSGDIHNLAKDCLQAIFQQAMLSKRIVK